MSINVHPKPTQNIQFSNTLYITALKWWSKEKIFY